MTGGDAALSGRLGLRIVRGDGSVEDVHPPQPQPSPSGGFASRQIPMRQYMRDLLPRRDLPQEVNEYRTRNLLHIRRGLVPVTWAKIHGIATAYGAVYAKILRESGEEVDLGLISLQLITSAGVNYIAADFAAGANDVNLFKFHGYGTGTNAEATGDTALQTELTTQYATDNTRPTGSQSSATNTYTTVGTLSPDANVAITEHGIFTQAATGGGTLLDRSVFSVINLVGSADSLQTTYVLTLTAGG
jgi:hypothetical protein